MRLASCFRIGIRVSRIPSKSQAYSRMYARIRVAVIPSNMRGANARSKCTTSAGSFGMFNEITLCRANGRYRGQAGNCNREGVF